MSDLSWHEADRPSRLARAAAVYGTSGKLCPAERAIQLLEAIIKARRPVRGGTIVRSVGRRRADAKTCLKPRGHSAPSKLSPPPS